MKKNRLTEEQLMTVLRRTNHQAVRAPNRDYLEVLTLYATDARNADLAFVESQNTMLFAAVGQEAT